MVYRQSTEKLKFYMKRQRSLVGGMAGTRLREWCLGNMEAENNSVFIKNVADWLGGASFEELNERLPDVAEAIYEHDTTGMAELFQAIEERLKAAFVDMVQRHGMRENSNILVVTHAFAIKTIFHLFVPEQLSKVGAEAQ
ncbi:MAG: histidine phosphatase family protein [Lachnospiraceae bacterium]|nr:histidine phosphatase family protein [Lachnospiraceae bacterium]